MLPRVGSPAWNDWLTLTGCGSRGATVIAGALQSDGVRSETELTRLDYLAGILDGWFQPQLVTAYQSVLRSHDASNGMRLRAMWLLGGLYAPDVEVAGPLQGYMTVRCERYDRSTSLRDAPSTLPALAYDQALDAVAAAANDRAAPDYVRATARCWEGVLLDDLRNGTREVPDVREDDRDRTVVVERRTVIVVERPVRVVYECGSRFVLYNDAGYDLAVRYDGYGNRGVLRVAHGGPYVWAATRFGPVRFWVGDREVWYTDAVYRPCGGTRLVYAPAVHIWTGWHMGLGVYVGSHRAVRPIVVRPRVTRPVVIINRRGSDDRPRSEPRNNPRVDPRVDPRDRPRTDPNDGRRAVPRSEPRSIPRSPPRGEPRNEPRNEPRTEPRGAAPGGGQRNQPAVDEGQKRGSVPLPRTPEAQRPRFAVPREDGVGSRPRGPDGAPRAPRPPG